jgi:predicted transcriptional regulator
MNISRQDVIRIPASKIIDVAKALSGDVRVRILEALGDKQMSITQLAEALGVAQPTITVNVQILEHAELLVSTTSANREKLCSVTCRSILLDLPLKLGEGLHQRENIYMPIGMYSHCKVKPPCGMASREGAFIGTLDDPRAFYMSERTDASLLWFSGAGYVEYYFANPMPPGVSIDELILTAELCSETPSFRMDWPSDITLSINGIRVGNWTSPSDFGDRKGNLTPNRWSSGTEYGRMTEWKVTNSGSFVNDECQTDIALKDLSLQYQQPIRVRLEVCEDAVNQGGLNLFGSSFGDHAQDLVLSFVRYSE